MKRDWWYRFLFLIFLTAISIMAIIPTLFKFDEDSKFPITSKINMGLDLQGGLYMILGIDFNNVYKDEIKGYLRKAEYELSEQKIESKLGELDVRIPTDPQYTLIISDPKKVEEAKAKIREYFANVIRMTDESGATLKFGLQDSWKDYIESQSVSKSIEVVRNRIDEFGVTEPEIISQGKDRIIVQLPGVKDIERAKELIGKTAKLEFKIVNDEISAETLAGWIKRTEEAGIVYKKGERFSDYMSKVNEFLKADLPKDYEIAFQKTVSKITNEIEAKVPFLVDVAPRITGDDLADASVQIDQQKNEPYVSMNFKSSGAKLFEKVTGENVGKRMAVILDGNVYTAPNIIAKIGGGRAQITLGTGNYNALLQQAKDIALVLRAGALPVQLDFLEQRIVGPSLGQDSISRASWASIISCVLVFIFAIIYYRLSGAIAVITLVLNVLFVLACLVGMGATLTLPGIAGIALTVGMAVDGNIIIYERIREEVRKKVSFYKSVEAGFDNAFWTILDANITTALAGLCLLNFGTGPVRGFAVTLLIGLAATVYTSYFVSKIFFEFYMTKVEGQDLSI
ncbi:MAG TPA: protein translocase subunit SecD [Bacteriovoracaceae bacterium]|nr:protein translocase subunit SecD [Bacteriovoracaceae bacterium]